MLPLLAALAGLASFGTARAALRAYKRVQAIKWPEPPVSSTYLYGGFDMQMTVEEARKILNVDPNASMQSILAKHRKVMLANHPDRGGSNYFASKINEAKDMLTKK